VNLERITLKLTSNALLELVKAEQDCFKEVSEAVDITRWIMIRYRVARTSGVKVR